MTAKLSVITVLVVVFGTAFSLFVQDGTSRPGSAFASEGGGDCAYEAGVVCTIDRSARRSDL